MFTTDLRARIHSYCNAQCDLCGLTIDDSQNSADNRNSTIWCRHCLDYFRPQPRCECCGLPTVTQVEKCGHCLSKPPVWNRLYCVGGYQSPLSDYIHKLKYAGRYRFACDLTYLLSLRIEEPASVIIPVPLHWKRYLKRGYNQSRVLGDYLCQHLTNGAEVDNRVFKRSRSTPPQQGLSLQERKRNLTNAFQLVQPPEHTHVAIIDDVVTSGATVRHLCQLLLDIEVEKIDIYCICRTPEPG